MAAIPDAASETHPHAEGRPLAACAWAIAATVAGFSALLGPLSYWAYGLAGVWSVSSAGVLCGMTGILAVWAARRSQIAGQALAGVLSAMAIRMGMPLAICLLLALRGRGDSFAGFAYYLLVFYLATLAVETWYSLPAGAVVRPSTARE